MSAALLLHQDDPALLRAAVEFTAAETGFISRLIEKDYFSSVVLAHLASTDGELTFKGGTCLSKVHLDFCRLSEDLDFSISTPLASKRAYRKGHSNRLRALVAKLPAGLPTFQILQPLEGANQSTHYKAIVGYQSLLEARTERISIEIGLREPVLTPPVLGAARTALKNPIDGETLVEAFPVRCLSFREAMAEKLRAALSRREVAIRDFFDIGHAVDMAGLDTRDPEFLDLTRRKLEAPGTDPGETPPALPLTTPKTRRPRGVALPLSSAADSSPNPSRSFLASSWPQLYPRLAANATASTGGCPLPGKVRSPRSSPLLPSDEPSASSIRLGTP